MIQPDFAGLFDSSFGKRPRRVDYSIRFGTPNSPHDCFFLSSLVHDAVLDFERLLLRGKRFTVPLTRECWELGLIDRDGVAGVFASSAMLSCSPVLDVEWRFSSLVIPPGESELRIESVFLGEDFWQASDPFTLVVSGPNQWWSARVVLDREDASVRIRDRSTPVPSEQFYSEAAG